jgi:hypothetical protein
VSAERRGDKRQGAKRKCAGLHFVRHSIHPLSGFSQTSRWGESAHTVNRR